MSTTFVKPAADRRDYGVEILFGDADTISGVSVSADVGITVEGGALAPAWTDTVAVVWLSGGTVGVTYSVTVTLTTTVGRILTSTFRIKAVQ